MRVEKKAVIKKIREKTGATEGYTNEILCAK